MTSPCSVDVYEGDDGGKPNIEAYWKAGAPWCLLGMKATEGLYYPKNPEWFQHVWPQARAIAVELERYGKTAFRWAYHYFRTDEDGAKQADFALGLIDSAGGWGEGDLPIVIDVESSEQPVGIAPQQVIDGVSSFAVRYSAITGREPILYAGSFIRDLRIRSHMGCQLLITAAYGPSLPSYLYRDMGWELDHLLGWQYQGTEGYSGPLHYLRECPIGSGPQDLTAITIRNGASYEQQLDFIQQLCRC